MRQPAKHHDANTRYLRRTVPGIGEILRLVLLSALHAMQRFPRVQDFVSYCRLVTGARQSAGKRYGTSGPKSGQAYLTWACADAAVVFRRPHPAGQKDLARLEKHPGKGKALPVLAHTLARALDHMVKRTTACAMSLLLQRSQGAARVSRTSTWTSTG
jgi:transposase